MKNMKRLLLLTSLLACGPVLGQGFGAFTDHAGSEAAGDLLVIEDISPQATQKISIGDLWTWYQTQATAFSVTVDANAYTADAGSGIDVQSAGALDIGNTTATSIDYGSASVTAHTFVADGTTDGDFVVPLTSIGGGEIVSDSLGPTQIDETAVYTWSGASLISGVHEVQDDIDLNFGNDANWSIQFDEAVDDQLLIETTGTAATAITDPLLEILVGTTPTADQQVFGIAKGTQASNTPLFTVDEDGDVVAAGDITVTNTSTDVLKILDSVDQSHGLSITAESNLTADRELQLTTGDANVAANLTDPAADTLMGWDDTSNTWESAAIGSGLDYDGATVKILGTRTEFVPVGWMEDGATPPAALETYNDTRKTGIRKFDGATVTEDCEFMWQLPADAVDAVAGGDWQLKYRVLWIVTEATGPSTSGPSFDLQGVALAENEDIGAAALGTAAESDAADKTAVQNDMMYSDYAEITLTGAVAGEAVFFKFARDHDDVDDDYAQDIGVMGIEFKFKYESATY